MTDLRDRLRRRKGAYQRLFPYENAAFVGPARDVLADLARFCRLNDPPVVKDAHGRTDDLQTGILIGRQEVLNRILAMVHVDDRRLFNLKEDDE